MRHLTDRLSRLSRSSTYDDPFGRQWAKDEDTGMVVLEPGRVDAVEDPAGDIFAEFEPGGTSVKVRLGNA